MLRIRIFSEVPTAHWTQLRNDILPRKVTISLETATMDAPRDGFVAEICALESISLIYERYRHTYPSSAASEITNHIAFMTTATSGESAMPQARSLTSFAFASPSTSPT